MKLYLNGKIVKEADASIAPADRGFTLGDGVFDTLLAVDGEPQFGLQHFRRLDRHAGALGIPLPKNPEELVEICRALLKENGFMAGRHAVRTTVTRGEGPRGLAPPSPCRATLVMRAAPTADAPGHPITVTIAKTVRRNDTSPLTRIKSLNYGDNLLALQEAQAKGFDDALMMNTKGHVVCATIANLFVRKNGMLLTPPLADGALNGIMRQQVMAEENVSETTLKPQDLLEAEQIFLTNSLRGRQYVSKLDDVNFKGEI